MTEFSNQGELSSTSSGTLLATGTISTSILDKLLIIRLHNPLAYVVSLYKYESLTNTTVLLYIGPLKELPIIHNKHAMLNINNIIK